MREFAYSTNGQQITAILDNDAVKAWNTLSGEMIFSSTLPTSHKLLFYPPHNCIIVQCNSEWVFDFHSGEPIANLNQSKSVDVSISHDGDFLVTLVNNNITHLWDTNDWENIV
jgi:WD40 repeat protein